MFAIDFLFIDNTKEYNQNPDVNNITGKYMMKPIKIIRSKMLAYVLDKENMNRISEHNVTIATEAYRKTAKINSMTFLLCLILADLDFMILYYTQ